MDPKSMKDLLERVNGFTGKVTWFQWPINEAPALPFVCYFTTSDDNFAADNINYYKRPVYAVELYNKTRDFVLEGLFEQAFADAGLYFSKEAEYLEDENCWVTVFTI